MKRPKNRTDRTPNRPNNSFRVHSPNTEQDPARREVIGIRFKIKHKSKSITCGIKSISSDFSSQCSCSVLCSRSILVLCSVLFCVLEHRTEQSCSKTCVLFSFIPALISSTPFFNIRTDSAVRESLHAL